MNYHSQPLPLSERLHAFGAMAAALIFALALLVPAEQQSARSGGQGSSGMAAANAPALADRPGVPIRLMSITVDDLPTSRSGTLPLAGQEEIIRRLAGILARYGVPAVGFVNESKLEVEGRVDPARALLLERWLDAGLELGNHGYAHLDLHGIETERWLEDILLGERVTRPLVEARGEKLHWFRHPFLHAGRTAEVQREVERFLADHGYRVAPVTIDNGEWIYAREFAEARDRDDTAAARRLGEDYVRYMLDVVAFYEQQSDAILGRALPHVLLIHANALNAEWLDVLLQRLDEIGYAWISLEEALEDPAYGRAVNGYTGAGGISWLHRWAITEGVDRTVFRGEPRVPAWVEEGAE